MRLSLSVPLIEGGRVGTRLMGLKDAGRVVHVCLEGFYVGENVVDSGAVCGGIFWAV